jgi:hypothetical protein
MPERSPDPEITFKPRDVLWLSGAVIETSAFSPDALHDFVILHTPLLTDRINRLYDKDRGLARRPEEVVRPTILIARLALLGHEHEALGNDGLDHTNNLGFPPANLTDEFVPYWDSIATTSFTPQVRVRGAKATQGTGGVWVGVTN